MFKNACLIISAIALSMYILSCSKQEEVPVYSFTPDKETFFDRVDFLQETYNDIRSERRSRVNDEKDKKTFTKMIDEERIVYHRRHMINTVVPIRKDNTLIIHCNSSHYRDKIVLKSIFFKNDEARIDQGKTDSFKQSMERFFYNTYDSTQIKHPEHPIAESLIDFNKRRYILLIDDLDHSSPFTVGTDQFVTGLTFSKVHVIDMEYKEYIDYFHIYAKNNEEVKITDWRAKRNHADLQSRLDNDLKDTFYATLLYTIYYVVHDAYPGRLSDTFLSNQTNSPTK